MVSVGGLGVLRGQGDILAAQKSGRGRDELTTHDGGLGDPLRLKTDHLAMGWPGGPVLCVVDLLGHRSWGVMVVSSHVGISWGQSLQLDAVPGLLVPPSASVSHARAVAGLLL